MTAERKGISSRYVCVCLSVASYVRKDLRTQSINMAGVVTGLLGQAKESLSIGCVKQFPVSSAKLLKLLPEGIEEYSQVLDELGYTVSDSITDSKTFMCPMQMLCLLHPVTSHM